MIAWNKSLQFRVIQILFSLYIFEDRTKGKKKKRGKIVFSSVKINGSGWYRLAYGTKESIRRA